MVKIDKVGNGCWLTSLQYLPQKRSQKRAEVTDNLRQLQQKCNTDSGPVNPVFPWVFFFFNVELRKEIFHELDVDLGLELCQEGWMRIKRGWVKDILLLLLLSHVSHVQLCVTP